jgi:hypothetical protein
MVYPTMPEAIEALHARLFRDLSWLQLRWNLYRQLFGTAPERIDLLNRFGSLFFAQVQSVLWDDISLRLCHMTDPPRSRGRAGVEYENASLKRLVELANESEPGIAEALMSPFEIGGPPPESVTLLMAKADEQTKPFRERRNREIAHRDYSRSADPMPLGSRQQVEDCLLLFRQIINAIEVHYTGVPTAYQHLHTIEDGDTLVFWLARLAEVLDAEKPDLANPLNE